MTVEGEIYLGHSRNDFDTMEVYSVPPIPGYSEIPFLLVTILPEHRQKAGTRWPHHSIWEVKKNYGHRFDLSKIDFSKTVAGTFILESEECGGLSKSGYVVNLMFYPGKGYQASISVDTRSKGLRWHRTKQEVIDKYTPYFGDQVQKLAFRT